MELQKYQWYEIEQRKSTSNALIGIFEVEKEDGSVSIKKDYILSLGHSIKKKEADEFIDELCIQLNSDPVI